MRRIDQEIKDRKAIDAVIGQAQVVRLGMSKDDRPYVVPLAFGYDGECIYFHSGKEGLKIEHLRANPYVCFEAESRADLVRHDTNPCLFNFSYRSVIGQGPVSEVTGTEDKKHALNVIMEHYTGRKWDLPDSGVPPVSVWKVKIDSLSGKQSGDLI